MKTILGVFFILMALGLFKTILPPFIAFFSLLRERAVGKSLLCILAVVIQVGLAVLLIRTGIGFFKSSPLSHEKKAVSQFIATMESANLASRVVNRGSAFSVMSKSDADELMRHYRAALAHAEKVDSDFLNEKYEGWGDHFEKECLAGLRLVVEGNDKADATISLAGQKLMDSWGDWFNQNVKEIRKLR